MAPSYSIALTRGPCCGLRCHRMETVPPRPARPPCCSPCAGSGMDATTRTRSSAWWRAWTGIQPSETSSPPSGTSLSQWDRVSVCHCECVTRPVPRQCHAYPCTHTCTHTRSQHRQARLRHARVGPAQAFPPAPRQGRFQALPLRRLGAQRHRMPRRCVLCPRARL